VVQGGEHPGGQHRIAIRQDQDARADADAAGLSGEVRHGDQNVEPVILVRVVLGDPQTGGPRATSLPSPFLRSGDPSSSPLACSRPRWAERDQAASLAFLL
jgi:hypothetical protein